MIRTAVCIVVALLAYPAAAQDQALTARKLYFDCAAINPDNSFAPEDAPRVYYCNGYLRGTWEGLQEMAFCTSQTVNIDRLRTAFKRMVEDNPQSMDKPAAWAVYAAFKIAYPCAANVPDRPAKKKPSTPAF